MGFRQVKGIYANLGKKSSEEKSGVDLLNEKQVISEETVVPSEITDNTSNLESNEVAGELDFDDEVDSEPTEETVDNSEYVSEDDSLPNALKLLVENEVAEENKPATIKRKYNKTKDKKKSVKLKKTESEKT